MSRTCETYTVVSYPRAGVAVAEFQGEHDLTTKSATLHLMNELLDQSVLLVLDLSATRYIDSSFIHSLLTVNARATDCGKHVRLQFGTAPIVRKALEISGVLEVLDHVSTREEAIRWSSAPRWGIPRAPRRKRGEQP